MILIELAVVLLLAVLVVIVGKAIYEWNAKNWRKPPKTRYKP